MELYEKTHNDYRKFENYEFRGNVGKIFLAIFGQLSNTLNHFRRDVLAHGPIFSRSWPHLNAFLFLIFHYFSYGIM